MVEEVVDQFAFRGKIEEIRLLCPFGRDLRAELNSALKSAFTVPGFESWGDPDSAQTYKCPDPESVRNNVGLTQTYKLPFPDPESRPIHFGFGQTYKRPDPQSITNDVGFLQSYKWSDPVSKPQTYKWPWPDPQYIANHFGFAQIYKWPDPEFTLNHVGFTQSYKWADPESKLNNVAGFNRETIKDGLSINDSSIKIKLMMDRGDLSQMV